VTRKYHACVAGGKPTVTSPGGTPPTTLVKKDLVVGTGATARRGQEVTVRYVLVTWSDGKEADASWQPFRFPLGREQVIEGFDQGVRGMRVGGRREVVIPPALGYGADGSPPVIAPDETLVFQVDLVEIH
jgi:peptidylprolyl isomerase